MRQLYAIADDILENKDVSHEEAMSFAKFSSLMVIMMLARLETDTRRKSREMIYLVKVLMHSPADLVNASEEQLIAILRDETGLTREQIDMRLDKVVKGRALPDALAMAGTLLKTG